MKNKNVSLKCVLLILVAAFGISFAGNAQLFIGGSISSGSTANSVVNGSTTTEGPSTRYFNFDPMVGYWLSEKWAIGGRAGIGLDVHNTNASTNTKTTTTKWNVTPFVRYSFTEFGKFALIGEGTIGVNGSKSKVKTGSTTTDGNPTIGFGLNIHPVLAYNISDHFSLELIPTFLDFGITAAITKNESADTKNISTAAKFNLDTDNLLGSLGSISIGALYKF
jgi:outer membrane protein